ncbi:phosphoenolpyruvate--protein phosphotransferase [Microbacterium sp.]|uniref:phosphoenolpyruvate--protein phosphotransferase n=1 Tax=Microbacterium sp. TaxID=51671 RepID=UPI00262D7116|nr:phosphoenolpyruvate--protein phosphotransferase [Microbacterium sp.]MCV0335536.1 phosphoenolpyruvate--protein phosphotransferase [Microbacterium sp.]MCV0376968.1 phosphoenolpyruvate--protein phosphotransferase [Microbacterium sp.]MCV0390554.1 phosphoenolpyruvate--protein phosphotransferase [Microbacterium sp.]MCV0418289.1 phosphoenolpyruvate--protein phosphotransferase [Microbacterium sp.]MCV0422043.1 phosphoenolpyruvate--protein phosphotransferase [Microbacterium sp.]
MIGIVAVSHSARLGEAALELALQMVHDGGVRVQVAAGAGVDAEGAPILGTDAVAVAAAIDELAAECEGVLVLMDLGSAVLSAELALELRSSAVPVRLAPAPFVEGLLAAVVSAAAGGTLDQVAAEATAALGVKTGALGAGEDQIADAPAVPQADGDVQVRRVRVRNPLGVHARPAALIARAAAGADVRLRRLPDGPDAAAASLTRLLVLGARQGDELELTARGDDATEALDRLVALFDDGFGEGTEQAPPETAVAPPSGVSGAAEASAVDAPSSREGEPARAVPPGTVLRGRGVSSGRVAAPVVHLAPPLPEPEPTTVVPEADRDSEVSAIEWAAVAVADQLRSRTAQATGETRAILDASRLLASDPELVSEATALVRSKGRSAARAVWETAVVHEKALAALGGRMAERIADIRDVRDRIIAEILQVDMPGVPERDEPFVLVATDLAPADTALLAGGGCIALVTAQGGPTSHTAIIARSLGLPAVVGLADAEAIPAGVTVLVDGDRGTVEVEPAPSRVVEARASATVVEFDGAGALADGQRVPLLANVGGAADATNAASAQAEGIGLFRTEFCFLDRTDAPSVDEQIAAYRGVLAAFPGRKVVVRTLDAGSDKPLPFANADREDNPALGVRGLRIARRRPQLLDDQLRALARAAAEEEAVVEVMAPMVATVDEAAEFADRCRAAGLGRVGIMIETPSAALLAAELFEVVDFVSLGTNDLAQYTMAADRLLSELGDLNDPWQPAVLRLIAAVGEAGRAVGKPVGVCGEAGGDPALAPVLVGLGVTSLSMAPRSLGRVAAKLSELSSVECARAAAAAVGAPSADAARAAAAAALVDG